MSIWYRLLYLLGIRKDPTPHTYSDHVSVEIHCLLPIFHPTFAVVNLFEPDSLVDRQIVSNVGFSRAE